MTTVEKIQADPALVDFITSIVSDPRFRDLKDAFVSYTPSGASQNADPAIAHGQYLGTRFVFNEMETLSKEKPKPKTKDKERGRGRPDPDLET